MGRLNRRDFMRHAAGMVAAGTWAHAAQAADPPAKLTATTRRTLGATGIECTLLGMGTGVKAWNGESALTRKGRETYLSVASHAYERGLRYFDMADMYGSHAFFHHLLSEGVIERDKVMLLTKSTAKKAPKMRADLDRFRKDLGTEYIDVLLFHCMTHEDWPEAMAACMDVVSEAKQKGVVRACGVSCHGLAPLERAVETPWVDVILARINPFGVKMDGPPDAVIPVLRKARAKGKGLLGMKILGEGKLRGRAAESIRRVLDLGVLDALTIGFLGTEEVDSAIAHIEAATA